jgi:hypothetical protein
MGVSMEATTTRAALHEVSLVPTGHEREEECRYAVWACKCTTTNDEKRIQCLYRSKALWDRLHGRYQVWEAGAGSG